MRYVMFECMTSSGIMADVKLTEQEAIRIQRNAAWKNDGYIYELDKFALKDFMQLNRAFWREEF